MAQKRVTEVDKQTIVELRSQGMSYGKIGAIIGISEKAVGWYCLALAVEPPTPGKSWEGIKGPAVVQRGGHMVRRFTAAEDSALLDLESRGATLAEMARALGRASNSIRGRLMTLARRDERREQHGEAA
ncbi:hypothetical protein [Methylosinus sp. Sm6]|uniref:hypothetical protein n=1 Tax=Methylosinus sp. Sm6 TaxID=2866948 RepID=UPI001C991667|nr:hypothetical protein [Methylosinus sp. Sm6]MBY6242807.1 hypothetical protein [Methylosinus sp. Sm6]